MDRWRKNRSRTGLAAALLAAGCAALGAPAAAERGDKIYENAWACSTLYGRMPMKVANGDDAKTAICLGEGKIGHQPMSRSEAWQLCRDQFDTTTQFVAWTSKGWQCRFYPR
jgi:hypothetical protein